MSLIQREKVRYDLLAYPKNFGAAGMECQGNSGRTATWFGRNEKEKGLLKLKAFPYAFC
jgi:hypothetical protein